MCFWGVKYNKEKKKRKKEIIVFWKVLQGNYVQGWWEVKRTCLMIRDHLKEKGNV